MTRFQLPCVAALALLACVGSSAAPIRPAIYQAEKGWICPTAGWITGLRTGQVTEHEVASKCMFGFPESIGGYRQQLVVLDISEYPIVFVCLRLAMNKRDTGVENDYYCGDTLATWLVSEDRRPASIETLRQAVNGSAMVDLRTLPTPKSNSR